jgi:rod shape-determining protein MreB
VFEPDADLTTVIKGQNLLRRLPESLQISQIDLYEALLPCAMEIVANVKSVIETAPPELVGDILQNGILLTGGGAMLGGLDKLIEHHIKAPCRLADLPLECVALGITKAFDCSEELLDGFEKISLYKYR